MFPSFHSMGFLGYIGVQCYDCLWCQFHDVDSLHDVIFIISSMWLINLVKGIMKWMQGYIKKFMLICYNSGCNGYVIYYSFTKVTLYNDDDST